MHVKDFMMQKYDRKKWYIPPSQLPPLAAKTESGNAIAERKPLKHLLGENAPAVVVHQEVQQEYDFILSLNLLLFFCLWLINLVLRAIVVVRELSTIWIVDTIQ